jgi:hypothetical protein
MNLEADKNYSYKYYLLSGIASNTKPIGMPFIEMTYMNDILISQNKSLIIR